MDKVSFHCSIYRLQGDKIGEVRLILEIPQSDMPDVARFYAENTEKLLGCALIVEKTTYKEIEEVVNTGEVIDGRD